MSYIFIHKWILPNQMSELWFSQVKKMIPPIRIPKNAFFFFFTYEKNDMSNQKTLKCVSFAPKFTPFIKALAAYSALCSTDSQSFNEKSFSRRVFLIKKWKASLKSEWNGFVCFTFEEENCREPTKQQQKRKKRTSHKLTLCFLPELLCLLFKCNLTVKPGQAFPSLTN